MTRKLLLLLPLLATAAAISCFAANITTRDGTIYRNAQVTGVDPDGIRVTHSTGVAKLRFEDLPEALQKQYHYDAAKVAAYRKQVEDAQKAAAAQPLLLNKTRHAPQRLRKQRTRVALRSCLPTQSRRCAEASLSRARTC